MTYDPYQNATKPQDPYSNYDRDGNDSGTGAAVILAAMLLLALGGFIWFFSGGDESNVARNDMRPPITQPSTTGSGANTPPAAQPARPAQ